MNKFLYGITLQWKLDLRNRGILLTYYVVPIVFFFFMGGIFTSIDPESYKTLIPSMTIFAVTMGSIIGYPTPLVDFFNSDIKKSYIVGKIPIWIPVINNFLSAFIHLFIVSLIILFISPIAFNANLPSNIPVYFFTLSLFIISSLSLGTLLGIFIKSTSKLTMICQFIFLPSIMLSGIMFPTNMLPSILKNIGYIFPATWAFETMCFTDNLELLKILPLIIITLISLLITIFKIRAIKKAQ